jgi:hypothetical protein
MKPSSCHLALFRFLKTALIAALVLGFVPGLASASEPVYWLKQNCAVTGEHVVYLSKRGVQITNLGTQAVLVSTAPAWQVCIYNKAAGKYLVRDADQFRGCFATSLMSLRGDNFKKLIWQHADAKPLNGIAADRFTSSTKNADKNTVQGLQDFSGIIKADYVVTHEDFVPPKVADAICRYYAIPSLHKVPLQFAYARRKKDFKFGLRCDQAKTVESNRELFSIPKGLTLAKQESEVMTDFADLLSP